VEVNQNAAEDVKEIVERDMIRAGKDFLKSVPVEVEIHIDEVWKK